MNVKALMMITMMTMKMLMMMMMMKRTPWHLHSLRRVFLTATLPAWNDSDWSNINL